MSSLIERIAKLNLPKAEPLVMPALVMEAAERLGVQLTLTSPSVPEQYDVFWQGRPCGYIRARRGGMAVRYPNAGGEDIYDGTIDGFAGFTDHEREGKLLFALVLIAARMQQE